MCAGVDWDNNKQKKTRKWINLNIKYENKM